jgi:hypothetical protein
VRRWVGPAVVAAATLALVGVAATLTVGTDPGPLPGLPHAAPECAARASGGDWLPDPACTPGARNPRVTQANIASTICAPGWATKERARYFPRASSEKVKGRIVREYGAYGGTSLRGYELDHLIPISLGGDPAAAANLWPEVPATPNPKDGVERWVHGQVCAGKLTLARAQAQIARDWTQLDAGDTTPRSGSGGETDE